MMLRVILTRFHLSSFPLLKGFNLILQMKCIALVTSFNCMSLVHFLHLSPSCTLGSFATSYAGRHWCLVTWEAVTIQQSHIALPDLQECVMVALTGKRDLEMAASCMKWTCGCGNSGEGIRDPEESMRRSEYDQPLPPHHEPSSMIRERGPETWNKPCLLRELWISISDSYWFILVHVHSQ